MVLDLLTFHDFSMFTFPFLFIPQKKTVQTTKPNKKRLPRPLKKHQDLGWTGNPLRRSCYSGWGWQVETVMMTFPGWKSLLGAFLFVVSQMP